MLALFILFMVALVAITIVVARIETCPYCGSIRLEKRKIDPKLNIARWTVRSRSAGKSFIWDKE